MLVYLFLDLRQDLQVALSVSSARTTRSRGTMATKPGRDGGRTPPQGMALPHLVTPDASISMWILGSFKVLLAVSISEPKGSPSCKAPVTVLSVTVERTFLTLVGYLGACPFTSHSISALRETKPLRRAVTSWGWSRTKRIGSPVSENASILWQI